MGIILVCAVALGTLELMCLAVCAFIYVAHADLAHSIEDLKHFTLLSKAETMPPETMARFLNPKPTMPGDVKITFPHRFTSEPF